MKLQIAVDLADTKRVLEIAKQVHDIVDIYEVGTPVIMKEGVHAVRALKDAYPKLCVLADAKIADGGAIECEDCCGAGADIITVMAFADDATIREVVSVAHAHGRKVLADLLCISDIGKRAEELVAMEVDYVGVHTGVDMQKRGRTPLSDLQTLVKVIAPEKAAVAGGVSMQTLEDYKALRPGIIIAGSALYQAPDIRKAALEMKKAINNSNNKF